MQIVDLQIRSLATFGLPMVSCGYSGDRFYTAQLPQNYKKRQLVDVVDEGSIVHSLSVSLSLLQAAS